MIKIVLRVFFIEIPLINYIFDISIDELIYPFIEPQSKYLPAKICPINLFFLNIKDLIESVI